MKKILILLGIVIFFTSMAFSIVFTGWTWIEESTLEESLDYCVGKHGSMITTDTRTRNNVLEYHAICVCNPGYEYNYFTNDCEWKKQPE